MPQNWIQRRLNNVLSSAEAVVYAALIFAAGAMLGAVFALIFSQT